MSSCRPLRLSAVILLAGFAANSTRADQNVALTAKADAEYSARKYVGGQTRVESYVFMQGNQFKGSTKDRSIERTSFREIAEYLAPQLARQQYLPARSAAEADLLIVVHWGATRPHVTTLEMTGRTSPVTDNTGETLSRAAMAENADAGSSPLAGLNDLGDNQASFDVLEETAEQVGSEMTQASNVALLGYADDLHKFSQNSWTTEAERTLRYDLKHERYFIILKAYDLKPRPNASRRPLWTMHVNISSPGNNFQTALTRMSTAAVDWFGRTTGEVRSVRPKVRGGRVELGPLLIIGEAK